MSNPVDIKIAHINKNENTNKSIDKDKVYEVFLKFADNNKEVNDTDLPIIIKQALV